MVEAFNPGSLQKALDIKNQNDVVVYSGGTDLMVRFNRGASIPVDFQKPVLFIGHLKELKKIALEEGFLAIGAAATLTEMLEHPQVPGILKSALSVMASPAVRNNGTLGGNICNASPAGDTLPPLYALGAALVLKSKSGSREIPIESFIKGPGKTDINQDEILTTVKIPLKDYPVTFYKKVGTRKADALSKLSFAGLAKTADGIVTEWRAAFGAVAPTVVRCKDIEKQIIGENAAKVQQMIPELVDLYSSRIKPIDDQRSTALYRKTTALRILEYFLKYELYKV